MGFRFLDKPQYTQVAPAPRQRGAGKISADLLHKQECNACPHNRAKLHSPKILPAGRDDGLIYMLGMAPTLRADDDDKPFAGPDLALIRRNVSPQAFKEMRFNNAIRCFPGEGKLLPTKQEGLEIYELKAPQFVELECCRPSIVRDIERTKPKAIFTFGSTALAWVNGETHPSFWQGRRMPVRVGNHECWLYPFVEPNFLYKDRRWEGHVSDNEIAFNFYLAKAADEVLNGLPVPAIHRIDEVRADVQCITGANGADDLRKVERFLRDAAAKGVNGLDYETNMLRPYNEDARLLTFGVSHSYRDTMAVGLDHRDTKWTQRERGMLWDMFCEYMRDPGPIKAVHQLAFEMEWSGKLIDPEILWGTKWACTLTQAFVINETQGLLAMENLSVQHYGFNIKSLSDVDRRNLANEPLSKVLPYNGMDAKYHLELFYTQEPILRDDGMLDFYKEYVERIPALVHTQLQGVPIDPVEVKKYREGYERERDEALDKLRECKSVIRWERENGKTFEPGNSHHFASLLKQIGLKLDKTDKGGDATDVKSINKYADKDPAIRLVWAWRKPDKVLSVYIDAVTPGSEHLYEDGLAHPIISATKVETSRTSSEDPNIQNWPKRNENAKVRKVVNKLPTYRVVSFDYAGIQGRNVAMESRDRKLTAQFIEGYDIHGDWLLRWHKVCPEWFNKGWDRKDDVGKKLLKAHRHGMKNQFVFPSFFGARPSETMCGNLQQTGIIRPKPKHVERLQEEFFDEYPDIAKWHTVLHNDYKKNGYVTGLSGHRRHAPVSHNQIINSPIQADEAKIVMGAHIALSKYDYLRYQPGMMIHDDLTFFWHKDDIDRYAEVVLEEMTRVRWDWVNPLPLEVEMSIGADWSSTEEVGAFKNKYDDGRAGIVQLKGEPRF